MHIYKNIQNLIQKHKADKYCKMNTSFTISDTLIGGLCREIAYIRQRYKNITKSLDNCRDQNLRRRLSNEIKGLKLRQHELINISVDKLTIPYNNTLKNIMTQLKA